MLNIVEIKPGMTFMYNNHLTLMISNDHKKLGRGRAIIKCKIKDLENGYIIVKTFSNKDKFEQAFLETKELQFLYSDNNLSYFFDSKNYEQFEILKKNIEWELNFINEGEIVKSQFYKKKLLNIKLNEKVILTIKTTYDISNKGNTVSTALKEAILSTNFKIMVPLFIKQTDKIIVSTSTGKYVGRA